MTADLVVPDANVSIKWVIQEPGSVDALHLLAVVRELHVPGLWALEVRNVLLSLVGRGTFTRAQAEVALSWFARVPLIFHRDEELADQAFDVASATGLSQYDATYVALAVRLGCQCVTADEKMLARLAGTQWATAAVALSDWRP